MNGGRSRIVVVLLIGFFAGVLALSYVGLGARRTSYVDPSLGQGAMSAVIERNDEAFPVPVPAHWEGEVFGWLEGGQAFAIRRPGGAGDFYAFFEVDALPLKGYVSIRGLWLGTTCAYRDTVFSGECVPEVMIRRVEPRDDEAEE